MARSSGSKRKARAVASNRFDEKLQRVAQALENATRVSGVPFATGTSERYPPPGLAFKVDDADERQFPDTRTIKARATVTQRCSEREIAWAVDGKLLEVRNARWHAFLKECVDQMREPLGIATAEVDVALRKMVLLEEGAHLHVRREDEKRRDNAFATLVVALPGTFEGGSLWFPQPERLHRERPPPHKDMTPSWRPAHRKNVYDLTYAALYDGCVVETEPITSGTALYVVYDVVIVAPNEVPHKSGSVATQRVVDAALVSYFDMTPVPLAKRIKISSDAWHTINEFISDRHFAYIVAGDSFASLNEDEKKVADSLAAFCAQSGGQFVLYHTGVLCSRESDEYKGYGDHSPLDDDNSGYLKVTLKSPWLKHGESVPSKFPYVPVRPERDVAPLGEAEDVRLFVDVYGMDMNDYAIIEKIHGDYNKTGVGNTFALVVMPLSVEQSHFAKVPLDEVVTKLQSCRSVSTANASQYARRVLAFRSPWTLQAVDAAHFQNLVGMILEMNDLELFKLLLHSIILSEGDELGALRSAVAHFGWEACAETLDSRIRSTASLSGRANLINAVVDASSGSERIHHLLDVLLTQHPWTAEMVEPNRKVCCESNASDVQSCARLLRLANSASFEKMLDIASATCPEALASVVVPALESLKSELDAASLAEIVRCVSSQLQRAKSVVPNGLFARVRLPSHCSNCAALQSFLTSTASEITMPYTGPASQLGHMETVTKRQLRRPASVIVRSAGPNKARLTKSLGGFLAGSVKRAQETLNALARASDA